MTLKELLEQHEDLEVGLLELRRLQDENAARRMELAAKVNSLVRSQGITGEFVCNGRRYLSKAKELVVAQDATPVLDPNKEV